MGVTYVIGNAEIVFDDLWLMEVHRLTAQELRDVPHFDEAPPNYADDDERSNVLSTSYGGAAAFTQALGLPRTVTDRAYPAVVPSNIFSCYHYDCTVLAQEHMDFLLAARSRDMNAGNRIWLEWWIWWVRWALENCERPAVYNR